MKFKKLTAKALREKFASSTFMGKVEVHTVHYFDYGTRHESMEYIDTHSGKGIWDAPMLKSLYVQFWNRDEDDFEGVAIWLDEAGNIHSGAFDFFPPDDGWTNIRGENLCKGRSYIKTITTK